MPKVGIIVDKEVIEKLKQKRQHKTFMEMQIESEVHQSTLSLLLKYPKNYKVSEGTHRALKSYCGISV